MRKVRLEIDAGAEEEVIIRCRKLTPEILRLQRLAEETDLPDVGQTLILRLADREFFVSQSEVLFFETDGRRTAAHTADRMLYSSDTLHDLEATLPGYFARASKSCLVNVRAVSSLRRAVTGVGEAFFRDSDKKIYISRMYYRAFHDKLLMIRQNR